MCAGPAQGLLPERFCRAFLDSITAVLQRHSSCGFDMIKVLRFQCAAAHCETARSRLHVGSSITPVAICWPAVRQL